jgi:photosystem II stability/assembly factor-like uncharacterized protein
MSENQTPQPAPDHPAAGLVGLLGNRRVLIYGVLALAAAIIAIIVLTSNSAPTWQAANAASGHVLTLLVDPQHADTIYAGNDQGKVLLSGDGGQTWTDRSAGLPGNANSPISALLEQSNDARLYAGTDGGVYASSDGGQHWSKSGSGLPGEDVVDALAFGSADGKTILAGTARGGVYISHDGGASWQPSGNGLPDHADIYGLTATPKYDAIFAALIGAGIYVSHDGGATWQADVNGLPHGVDAFSIATGTNGKGKLRLYAATGQGVYFSDDGGATWHASNNGLPSSRVIAIAVEAQAIQSILCGGDAGAFGSNDYGANWHTIAAGLPAGQHVGAVAIVQQASQGIVVFAAADRLYRYPGVASPISGILVRLLGFGVVIALVVWLTSRNNRILRDVTPVLPRPPQKTATPTSAGQVTPRRGATGHIRGGPPPRPPKDNEKG